MKYHNKISCIIGYETSLKEINMKARKGIELRTSNVLTPAKLSACTMP